MCVSADNWRKNWLSLLLLLPQPGIVLCTKERSGSGLP